MIPPNSIEAEQSVLGAMLLENEAALHCINELSPECFYQPKHAAIFTSCVELFTTGTAIDMITVSRHILGSKAAMGIELSYLAKICENAGIRSTLHAHVQILKETAKMREIITLNNRIMDMCYKQKPIDWITDDFGHGFFGIVEEKTKGAVAVGDAAKEAFADIKKTHEEGILPGVMTGFSDLDRRVNGYQPADLIILAARPAMGKTALAIDIAANVASRGIPVMVFSLEMSAKSLGARLISRRSQVSGDSLRKGIATPTQMGHARAAVDHIAKMPIWIDETGGLKITELVARAKMLMLKHNFGIVIVDYLQLLAAKAENRTNEIGTISRMLKQLAKDLKVPVLALSQLNRGVESRDDKRPRLSDLRESGAIEQDADVIHFIYRDEVYNQSHDNPNRGIADIITAKQRNGPTGNDKLLFRGEFSRFYNYER